MIYLILVCGRLLSIPWDRPSGKNNFDSKRWGFDPDQCMICAALGCDCPSVQTGRRSRPKCSFSTPSGKHAGLLSRRPALAPSVRANGVLFLRESIELPQGGTRVSIEMLA